MPVDDELMRTLQLGNEAAYEELVREMSERLKFFLCRMGLAKDPKDS